MTRPATAPPESIQATRAILVTTPMLDPPAIVLPESIRVPRANRYPTSIQAAPAIEGPDTSVHSRAKTFPASNGSPPALQTIRDLGSLLDDIEAVRIAQGNRIATQEREHGEAMPHLDAIQAQLRAAEHMAELELVRVWRRHHLAGWAKQQRGVGEKSIARLIAIIGDPADRPNVAKVWAYCGHGDPRRSTKRKGMTQEELFKQGNPRAKKQVWLIATALLKTGNRAWYDEARERYAERVHAQPCVRCGPAGRPAPAGSPWSDGHKHAAALRYVGKMFLKELWIVARHHPIETQGHSVGRQGSSDHHLTFATHIYEIEESPTSEANPKQEPAAPR